MEKEERRFAYRGMWDFFTRSNKRSHWCNYSGFSKNMTRDRNTFLSLKERKEGIIMFGNDNSSKILGKGIVCGVRKDALEKNVLLIENMNNNILSVSQMCGQ